MLEIKLYRTITCDNGQTYTLSKPSYDEMNYTYGLYDSNWKEVNQVHEYYLEDCIRYGQPVCVGRKSDGNSIYAKIVSVNPSEGEKRQERVDQCLKMAAENLQMLSEMSQSVKESTDRIRLNREERRLKRLFKEQ